LLLQLHTRTLYGTRREREGLIVMAYTPILATLGYVLSSPPGFDESGGCIVGHRALAGRV
jgi:hypothetical protein